jgi:2'-hydroxyisoflavone reductase
LRLLILGGTLFLGRHLTQAALERGHAVTLFNRGQHNTDLFPQAEKLRGDRDGDLTALEGRRWDAAIDVHGRVPRIVRASAALLAPAVGHYTFISTTSVYGDQSIPTMDEHAPLATIADPTIEDPTGPNYGPLKALSEQAVAKELPGRALIVRPGLIVGPYDPTNRFTYWPRRVAQGGDVLAPDGPEHPARFIDARDLAAWTILMIESGATGIYNARGPNETLTFGELLATCKSISGSDARFVWANEQLLLDAGVRPYTELPLWIPNLPERAGFYSINSGKAIAAGLTFRPVAETIRATLAWDATQPPDAPRPCGLRPERERELLEGLRRADLHSVLSP